MVTPKSVATLFYYSTTVPRPTPLPTPNGIQIQSAVFPQFANRT